VTPIDPLAVAALVAAVLEKLRIPYVIGGSVASSVLGEPRSTLDLDLMIDAAEPEVRLLVSELRQTCYVDEEDAVDSIRSLRSFNAIHLGSSTKIDFFPAEELGRQQIARRRAIVVRPDLPPLNFYSPEDLIIRKLLWYRAGNESSARQWRDVVSILKVCAENLDRPALLASALDQRMTDLLDRAVADAGTSLGGGPRHQ
jgi:hypothetical protein